MEGNQGLSFADFAQKLLEERLGPERLKERDPEHLAQMKDDLVERVENRVKAGLLEHLPPEKLPAFEALLDSNASDEATQQFLATNIPDLEQVVAGILLAFRDDYLGTR